MTRIPHRLARLGAIVVVPLLALVGAIGILPATQALATGIPTVSFTDLTENTAFYQNDCGADHCVNAPFLFGTASAPAGQVLSGIKINIQSNVNLAGCPDALNPAQTPSALTTSNTWGCSGVGTFLKCDLHDGMVQTSTFYCSDTSSNGSQALSFGTGTFTARARATCLTGCTGPGYTDFLDFGWGDQPTSAHPGYVSILFGRAQWRVTDENCTVDTNGPTLQSIATWMNGLSTPRVADALAVYDRIDQGASFCTGANVYAGTAQLAPLVGTDGWNVDDESLSYDGVDVGQSNPTYSYLTAHDNAEVSTAATDITSDINAECGTLGLTCSESASGMFAYPNNLYFDTGGTPGSNFPVQCFIDDGGSSNTCSGAHFNNMWGRTYGGLYNVDTQGLNTHGFQFTTSVQGCGTSAGNEAAACAGTNNAYQDVSQLESMVALVPSFMWTALEFYKLIGTGTSAGGSGSFSNSACSSGTCHWNCSTSGAHYTWSPEVYCYNDFRNVINAIGDGGGYWSAPAAVVNTVTPATVAAGG